MRGCLTNLRNDTRALVCYNLSKIIVPFEKGDNFWRVRVLTYAYVIKVLDSLTICFEIYKEEDYVIIGFFMSNVFLPPDVCYYPSYVVDQLPYLKYL